MENELILTWCDRQGIPKLQTKILTVFAYSKFFVVQFQKINETTQGWRQEEDQAG
jgi:hypothetical protein